MLNDSRYKLIFTTILGAALLSACASHGLNDKYRGATEQRLVTHSVDRLVQRLPEKDFSSLAGVPVHLTCHFLENADLNAFVRARLALELRQKYGVLLVQAPEQADIRLHFFFNAIGTDQDTVGFKTPEFIVPGTAAMVSIDIITLERFHGVSELYYYIEDAGRGTIHRGEKVKQVVRSDRLSLPLISIPLSNFE
jgi:hypothetical protein